MISAAGSEKLESSVICKEVFDDGYQPSVEEINEYAVRIGIDPDKESQLLHLARDGLMQALPDDWQICYHKQQGVYYTNSKTKTSQWEHPLDCEYKLLVKKARYKLSHADLSYSEETSQIDSGIKSLPFTEEATTDSSIDSQPKSSIKFGSVMDSVHSLNSHNRFLQPIERKVLQPLDDLIRNKRFEVSNYNLTQNADVSSPFQIGLNIKTDDSKSSSSVVRNDKEPVRELTLSGTGSMFLKSNTKKDTVHAISTETTSNILPVSSLASANVKGILRDTSLTDVRNKQHFEQRSLHHDYDSDDRKSVRFNLEKLVQLENKLSSDDDEDEDDEWDFMEGDNAAADNQSHVKDVTVFPNKPLMPLKPRLLKSQHSLDELKKPIINKRISLGRTVSIDSVGTSKVDNLSTLFERQIERNSSVVKPMYEDSDSESIAGSVKEMHQLSAEEERHSFSVNATEESQKEKLRIQMQKRLEQFQQLLKLEQLNEEEKIRDKMHNELLEMKNKLIANNKAELEILHLKELKTTKGKEELEKIIANEKIQLQSEIEAEIRKLTDEHEKKIKDEVKRLQIVYDKQVCDIELEHQNQLSELTNSLDIKKSGMKADLDAQHSLEIDKFRQQLKDEFYAKTKEISNEHRAAVEILQLNHSEILQDLERDLKTEKDLIRKDHSTNLAQLKIKLAHELELERQKMKESGENHLYEKIRCEKRLLEDKYRCLKEKYVRLKSDVKMTLERRSRRREHHSITTGSETERSHSTTKQSLGNSDIRSTSLTTSTSDRMKATAAASVPPKLQIKIRDKSMDREYPPVKEKKFAASVKYMSHVQQQLHSDTTSVSDTTVSNNFQCSGGYLPLAGTGDNGNSDSEAFSYNNQENNNIAVKDTPGRQRKKFFSRMKSASTSKLNSSGNRPEPLPRPCTPVENLRRQLQKLEELEDQFPDNPIDTTYHLRYPFKDISKEHASASSELEFFKHRIHMERDSVRRAKESLRMQRTNFRSRQREIKQRQKSSVATRHHTLEQLIQEEKELTEMEVNLHRTRALLGEKVIRLRHLEHSLQQVYDKENPSINLLTPSENNYRHKDDATISDLSSHSSSGFSSNDFASETANHGNRRKEKCQAADSSEIIQYLDNLNTEIREIWDILSKQHSHGGLPPPPSINCQQMPWPKTHASNLPPNAHTIEHTSSAIIHQVQPIPTLADRLETYRQLAAHRSAAVNTTASVIKPLVAAGCEVLQQQEGKTSISLVERTQDLRNWLKQAKTEHALLNIGGQQTNL